MQNNTIIGSIIGTKPTHLTPGMLPGAVNPINITNSPQTNRVTPQTKPREHGMARCLNYYADFSGCGFWRMIWPEHIMNAYQKAIVHGSTVMVTDKKYYTKVKCVRIQRQATPAQLKFYTYLKNLGEEMGFSVVYEIDDIVFHEDIPDYNKFKGAFVDEGIRRATTEMMTMSDEITVTCPYMKDYYESKTGNKNITVIPNYPPRFWLDQYDELETERNYNKRRKKPRVLYAGSGAHFDVDNIANQKDDFHHVVQTVRKTVNKYQWIFIGAFPMGIRDLVRSGKVEYHPWVPLYDYPRLVKKVKANVMVAPLHDNVFNKAKSDLKWIEGCALGLPTICQDLCTYQDAQFKFTTGAEMVDQIDSVMADKTNYMKIVRKNRMIADTRWLENPDNIGKYVELYTTKYGSNERKLLK